MLKNTVFKPRKPQKILREMKGCSFHPRIKKTAKKNLKNFYGVEPFIYAAFRKVRKY